jgi:SAM-dependent methyltransferase
MVLIMGKLRDADWYSDKMDVPRYDLHYSETVYFDIWKEVLKQIQKDEKIFELGCGTGQFAEMCFDMGYNYVCGIDFSESNINKCKERNKNNLDKFIVDDVYEVKLPPKDVTIVALEVLEHIVDDKMLVNRFSDYKMIVTLPNFDCEGHVRLYESGIEIIARFNRNVSFIKKHTFEPSKNGIWTVVMLPVI